MYLYATAVWLTVYTRPINQKINLHVYFQEKQLADASRLSVYLPFHLLSATRRHTRIATSTNLEGSPRVKHHQGPFFSTSAPLISLFARRLEQSQSPVSRAIVCSLIEGSANRSRQAFPLSVGGQRYSFLHSPSSQQ